MQLLWERFKQFARDTEAIGTERVRSVNAMADQLISNGHNDSAIIAEHKDGLNESWQDLLELIDTRTQVNCSFSDTEFDFDNTRVMFTFEAVLYFST